MAAQLPSHSVALVLVPALITLLDAPLASHNVSSLLHDRHRFLALDPAEDEAGYLSWPDSDPAVSACVAQELLYLQPPADADPLAIYDTVYTDIRDTMLAHARVSDRLRLVFRWEPGCDDTARVHRSY